MSKGKRVRAQRKEKMADKPSPDEVAALLNGLQRAPQQEQRQPSSLEVACGGRLMLVQTPAEITLKGSDGTAGETFYVTDLQAWGYTPFGILAVGSYTPDASEDDWESRVFAVDTIHNIKFDKVRYEAIIEEIKAEEAAAEAEDAPEEIIVPEGASV